MGINYFYFNKKSSLEFQTFISGEQTFRTPKKDLEIIKVPGKNGTLSISKGRYENVEIPYSCYIAENFSENYDALKAYLLSQDGYKELSDTYNPDVYRLARYVGGIEPEMTQYNKHGTFNIVFDCDPRRFLKRGAEFVERTTGTAIVNDTLYEARPVIRAYGTGTLSLGGVSVTVSSANVYTDIDAELQEAYKGTTNRNAYVTLTNGVFPTLKPGSNTFTFSGFSKVEIKTNLWTI